MSVVLKDFKCKITKRVYRAGDEYDGNRTEELQALGYVAAEEGGGEPEKPKRKRKDSE